ncbi:MAG: hypothetical protein JOZ81_14785, partial [Chloroflexi bacterium]|nr:hypothetical protein [Chloroflexota bacterium]
DLVGSGPAGGILWQPGEGVTSLGASVSPNGLNDRVEVVGELQAGGGTTHAFVWQARRGVQDLGVLPGMTNSTAFAINPRGQIVGASFNPSQPGFPLHAVLWNPS